MYCLFSLIIIVSVGRRMSDMIAFEPARVQLEVAQGAHDYVADSTVELRLKHVLAQ